MTWSGVRIVLVGPLAPPSGGMANQMTMFDRLLQNEGAVVTVVRSNAPYIPAWIANWRGVRALARMGPYLAALWRAASRCDLLHVMANSGLSWYLFAAPAVAVARLRGVPCIVHYHGGEAERFLARWAQLVVPALKAADALVVPSGFLQSVFARHGVQSSVVPNVVNMELFGRRRDRDHARPVLVVARNLEAIYDLPTALRAFAEIRRSVPGVLLSIAGTGPEERRLRELAAQLRIADAVTFTGRLSMEGMAALLASATVMLNPSTADNLPVSILEAMVSGVAVVSTRAGGIPRLVRDGETGLLVDVGDAAAMARAVVRLLEDPELQSRITDAASIDVEHYGWASVRESLRAVYGPILDRYASAERAVQD